MSQSIRFASPHDDASTVRRTVVAGALIGVGMGGFVDGIVFHQILQIHNMLSARIGRDSVVTLEVNMFWDGLFHAFTWITTAIGIALLWRAGRLSPGFPATRRFTGALLIGWGAFNVVEGIIDHEILQVHHVLENGDHLMGDLAFLAFGALLCVMGWRWVRPAAELRSRS